MNQDARCTPPRFHMSSSTAPSLAPTDTQTTLCEDSSPASPARLQGGSELTKICSSRLGTAEAMLAGSGRDDLERCRAERVDEEKEGTTEGKESIGAGPAQLVWDYPEGGRGWWVVLVRCLLRPCFLYHYGGASHKIDEGERRSPASRKADPRFLSKGCFIFACSQMGYGECIEPTSEGCKLTLYPLQVSHGVSAERLELRRSDR